MNKKMLIVLAVAAILAVAIVVSLLIANIAQTKAESGTPTPGNTADSQITTDPVQPSDKPSEKPTEPPRKPDQSAEEPAEKPTEPPRKPDQSAEEPAEKPTEPPRKPDQPTEDPEEPEEEPGQPDDDNTKAREFADYLAMSGQEQEEFAAGFHSLAAFVQWYYEAREAYEKLYPGIEIDG